MNMDDVLSKAGLQLASTDPEKLRAAQEAAAQAASTQRVGRARKPVVVPVDEPLIQVDTSRQ
jgi:ribonuclease E